MLGGVVVFGASSLAPSLATAVQSRLLTYSIKSPGKKESLAEGGRGRCLAMLFWFLMVSPRNLPVITTSPK